FYPVRTYVKTKSFGHRLSEKSVRKVDPPAGSHTSTGGSREPFRPVYPEGSYPCLIIPSHSSRQTAIAGTSKSTASKSSSPRTPPASQPRNALRLELERNAVGGFPRLRYSTPTIK